MSFPLFQREAAEIAEPDPVERHSNWAARLCSNLYPRRAIDFLLASFLLAMLLPVFIVVAIVIKISSPGPIFYFQERVGLNGMRFWMFKFRTMRTDAEAETGPVWAVDVDPRCTLVGKMLRRYSIDEFPQLINVLRGEMSLIGPRPERPHFVKQFAEEYPEYEQRHLTRPGMSGWAQVNGWRGQTSLVERLRCDLYYVRHQSLMLDAWILLLTPLAVIPSLSAAGIRLALRSGQRRFGRHPGESASASDESPQPTRQRLAS